MIKVSSLKIAKKILKNNEDQIILCKCGHSTKKVSNIKEAEEFFYQEGGSTDVKKIMNELEKHEKEIKCYETNKKICQSKLLMSEEQLQILIPGITHQKIQGVIEMWQSMITKTQLTIQNTIKYHPEIQPFWIMKKICCD